MLNVGRRTFKNEDLQQCCRPGHRRFYKGTLLGTPSREPQEYSRYIIGVYLPGSLDSIIFLLYLGFPVESLYFREAEDLGWGFRRKPTRPRKLKRA